MGVEIIASLVTVLISYFISMLFDLSKKMIKKRDGEIVITYNKSDSKIAKELLEKLEELEKNDNKDIKVVFNEDNIIIKYK